MARTPGSDAPRGGGRAPRGRGRGGEAPRARLFVALDPDPEARAALAGWRDALVGERAELRAVPGEALHVTLAFLGHRPATDVEAIARTALEAAGGHEAARLAPTGLRALPPRAPRLFALDLADAGGACARLQAAVAGALAAAGHHEPERRPFWPHMTVARVRGGRAAPPLDAPVLPEPFRAGAVVLYRSRLGPQGARYEPLARAELA